ncbi:MAG TPA: hypothetical protein PLB89_09225 [Flavobacteriales bacterium]|nr:hypothetical protein [Flavobacteriales bacterium]
MRTPLLVLLLACVSFVHGQEPHHDTTFKNTVRFNLTPLVLSGSGNYVVGYERILGPKRSFSVNTGLLALPELLPVSDSASYEWKGTNHNRGFSFAADYRMYFTKRNRFAIPDGLYWGPYITYYYFDNNTSILTRNGHEAQLQSYVNMLMVGAELGYQVVIHDRWTVDLILAGPALGWYRLDMTLSSNVELGGSGEYEDLYDALSGMFPLLNKLITDDELRVDGSGSTWGAGFRYVFQVGYRF